MSTLSPDRWQEASPYLDQALAMSDEERALWLKSLHQKNPQMATLVQTLLDEHSVLAQERFLEDSPVPPFGRPALAGQTIGAYTLLSLIGEGGMGSVWLAERSDGRFERRVAVKCLGIGLAGPACEERFKREGSILGRLTHPHIAELLDAGLSPNGQPYLVLEYVEGKHIDQYCDQGGLNVEERTRLFLDVLEAVAHAHANLIVHRDIKPSNVLVRTDGVVKLLDFGIAKLLEGEAQDPGATPLTVEGGRLMTPQYAAPEQLSGGAVTTATDVYALGVLFYLLLTGQHPAGDGPLTAADLVRAIVDTEPPRLSVIVSRAKVGAEAQVANAARRTTTPDKLGRSLRGDLDTIVAKALKKNPAERYVSVTPLADDLRRYLRHEPISARPDTIRYRTTKFIRRKRALVAAAALVVASLSAGLYLANHQRAIAERRFQQLRQLSNKVFDLDEAIKRLPGSTQARQSLVSASLEYLQGLASYAHGDLDLAREVGEGYWRVGRIQGVPVGLNLGDETQAEITLKKADELIDTVLVSRPTDRTALFRSAVIAHDRMILAQEAHRNADAMAFARRSADRMETFLHRKDVQDSERNEVAGMYVNLALVSGNIHMYENAIGYARRTVEIARPMPSAQRNLSGGLRVLANALQSQGDLEGALQAVHEARKIADETVYSDGTVRMATMCGVLSSEGRLLGEDGGVNLDQPEKAIKAFQECVDLADAEAQKDPNDALSRIRVGNVGDQLGNVLRQRDPQRALDVYDLVIRRLREIRNDIRSRQEQAAALANSSYALRRLHRGNEAKQRIDAALAILKETKDYPAEQVKLDSEIFTVTCALADYEADEDDPNEAVATYKQLLEKVMAAKPEALTDLRDALKLSRLYESLGLLYGRSGDTPKMQTMTAQRLELWRHWDGKLPNNAFVRRQLEAASRP